MPKTQMTLSDAEGKCLKLKQQINENHRLAQTAAGEAVERGVLTGDLLAQWKELLPHGRFESFVETHFDGSLRTAQLYMQAAKRLGELSNAQRIALLKKERSITGIIEYGEPTKKPPRKGTETASQDEETAPRPPRNGREKPGDEKPSKGHESPSAAKLADALSSQHIGHIARGLTAIAKANGGEGLQFQQADAGLNQMIRAIQEMRKGKR